MSFFFLLFSKIIQSVWELEAWSRSGGSGAPGYEADNLRDLAEGPEGQGTGWPPAKDSAAKPTSTSTVYKGRRRAQRKLLPRRPLIVYCLLNLLPADQVTWQDASGTTDCDSHFGHAAQMALHGRLSRTFFKQTNSIYQTWKLFFNLI